MKTRTRSRRVVFRSTTTRRCGSGQRSRLEGPTSITTRRCEFGERSPPGKLGANHNGTLRVRSAVKARGPTSITTTRCEFGQRSTPEGTTSITTTRCEFGQVEGRRKQPQSQRGAQIRSELEADGQPQSQRVIAEFGRPSRLAEEPQPQRNPPLVAPSSLSDGPPPGRRNTRARRRNTMPAHLHDDGIPNPGAPGVRSAGGAHSPQELLADAERLDATGSPSGEPSGHHLVAVASELASAFGFDCGSLDALGLPVDLLDCFSGLAAWLASAVQTRGHRSDDRSGRSRRCARFDPTAALANSGFHSSRAAAPAGRPPIVRRRDALRCDRRSPVLTSTAWRVWPIGLSGQARSSPLRPARLRHGLCPGQRAGDAKRAGPCGAARPPRVSRRRVSRRGRARFRRRLGGFWAFESSLAALLGGRHIVHDVASSFWASTRCREHRAARTLSQRNAQHFVGGARRARRGARTPRTGAVRPHRQSNRSRPDRRRSTSTSTSRFSDDSAARAVLGRSSLTPPRARFVDDVLAIRRLVEGHFLPARDMRRHVRAEYDACASARHPLLLDYGSTLGGTWIPRDRCARSPDRSEDGRVQAREPRLRLLP